MLGLLAQLTGLFLVGQFLEKWSQAAPRIRIELIFMAEIEIKPQPFPIKDVIAASDRFAHQLGVILRQDIGGHVFHGDVELARNRLITINAVLSS